MGISLFDDVVDGGGGKQDDHPTEHQVVSLAVHSQIMTFDFLEPNHRSLLNMDMDIDVFRTLT